MKNATYVAIVLSTMATASLAAPKGAPPAELRAMLGEFSAAVQSNNRKAAEALTAFPLANEAYQSPKSIPLAKFGPQFEMYRAFVPGCAAKTRMQLSKKQWQLDCDGNILWFGQKDGKWRHIRYENVNE